MAAETANSKLDEKVESSRNLNILNTSKDIVKHSFDLLTRKEERGGKFDNHQRYLAENSELSKNLTNPIIARYILLINKLIDEKIMWEKLDIKNTVDPERTA